MCSALEVLNPPGSGSGIKSVPAVRAQTLPHLEERSHLNVARIKVFGIWCYFVENSAIFE